MAAYAIAGSKLFIGTAVDAKGEVAEADFTAAVWVEVKDWVTAGAIGDTQEIIEQNTISGRRTRKVKGVLNGGTMENQFLPNPADPGQTALKTAMSDCKPYQFKIEWGADCLPEDGSMDGMTSMFLALVAGNQRQGGDANAIQLMTVNLAIDSNILEV